MKKPITTYVLNDSVTVHHSTGPDTLYMHEYFKIISIA